MTGTRHYRDIEDKRGKVTGGVSFVGRGRRTFNSNFPLFWKREIKQWNLWVCSFSRVSAFVLKAIHVA